MSYIVCRPDDSYGVVVRGHLDCQLHYVGRFPNEDEAQAAWRQAEKVINDRNVPLGETLDVAYEIRLAEVKLVNAGEFQKIMQESPDKVLETPNELKRIFGLTKTKDEAESKEEVPYRRIRVEVAP